MARARDRRTWTVRRRLGALAALSACSLSGLLIAGTLGLASTATASRAVDDLVTTSAEQQSLQRAAETVRAEVVSGALAATHGDIGSTRQALTVVQREGRSAADVRRALAGGAELSDTDHALLADASTTFDGYLEEGAAVLTSLVEARTTSTVIDLARVDAIHARLIDQLGHLGDQLTTATRDARANEEDRRDRAYAILAIASLAGLVTALTSAALVRRSIIRSLGHIGDAAAAVADGDLTRRIGAAPGAHRAGRSATAGGYDGNELDRVSRQFDRVADTLEQLTGRLHDEAQRSAFRKALAVALEMVDTESEVYAATRQAMVTAAPDATAELLLSDATSTRLEAVAEHPVHGAAGCSVVAPLACAAVRRGANAVFDTSLALDACPKLAARPGGPHAAVCAPVSFMGRSLGVAHFRRGGDEPFSTEEIDRIGTLAAAIGSRIGTVRAFERTERRASTDGLTGLLNRRTLEEQVGLLSQARRPYAVALADLDHFKALNDRFGHEMGDRALRTFADVLRRSTRDEDLVARWGGEEFVIVFADLNAFEARTACERVRAELSAAVASAEVPQFTVSFGLADSAAASDQAELFRLADEALYRAKDEGRDRMVVGPLVPVRAGGPLPRGTAAGPVGSPAAAPTGAPVSAVGPTAIASAR